MWDCENCGTTNIAGSLEVCPHCQSDRVYEPVGTAAPTEGAAEGREAPDAPTSPQPTKQSATDKKGAW